MQHYERAYASFRRRPDPALAGLCALALYFAHRVSLGNVAASRGWLGRLARLVDEHDLGPLRGWVALALLTATGRWDAADRELQRALHSPRTAEPGMIAEVAAALA